jgi:excisionase family DNA binding protein
MSAAPTTPLQSFFLAPEQERALTREAARSLGVLLDSPSVAATSVLEVTLKTPGTARPLRLPVAALRLLREALDLIGQGHAVRVLAQEVEMTTGEAAEALGVSRPHLVQLLERGDIPFRRVGAHRRVRYGDLLAYRSGDAGPERLQSERLQSERLQVGRRAQD